MASYSNNHRRVVINAVVFTIALYALFRFIFAPEPSEAPQVPIIVIPGGGLTSEGNIPDYGKCSVCVWYGCFIIHYNKLKIFVCDECSGSPHGQSHRAIRSLQTHALQLWSRPLYGHPHVPPPRDAKDFPLYEATIGARYLLKAGIPAGNIFEEKLSLDTLGNVSMHRSSAILRTR